jgi:hypothetical protein
MRGHPPVGCRSEQAAKAAGTVKETFDLSSGIILLRVKNHKGHKAVQDRLTSLIVPFVVI